MWIFLAALIVIGLVLAALARRRIPKTYKAVNATAWVIEGLFVLLAIVALIFQLFGFQPL
jgi:hypothetical protein